MSQTAYAYKPVTPSNTVDIPSGACDALWVGIGGDVECVSTQGGVVVFKNVPSGFMLLTKVARVNATNTTAASIVALYA